MTQRHLTEEDIDDFVRDVLSESRREGVEEHLLLCEHCRNYVDGLDQLVAGLRITAGTAGPVLVVCTAAATLEAAQLSGEAVFSLLAGSPHTPRRTLPRAGRRES